MNILFQVALRAAHVLTYPFSGMLLHNSNRTRVLMRVGNEILLIRTSFGHQKWSLPGGGIKRGEDAMVCAIREFREETGIHLESSHLKKIGEARLPKEKKWPKQNLQFFEATATKKPVAHISRPLEIMEIGWFDVARLPENTSSTVNEGLRLAAKLA